MDQGRKVALVVAPNDYRDEEYERPRAVLEAAGAQVVTVSRRAGLCHGMLGGVARADLGLSEALLMARNDLWDAVAFVGGSGAETFFHDGEAHALAREVAPQGHVIGAICIAPATLANAGLLSGIQATSFASVRHVLEDSGAIWVDEPVISSVSIVADGAITVTANGPSAAVGFGQALTKGLGL